MSWLSLKHEIDAAAYHNQSHNDQYQFGDDVPFSVHIIGDVFCDIITQVPVSGINIGGDTLAKIKQVPGGSALNVACHLEANSYERMGPDLGLDLRTSLYSMVGDDPNGAFCIEALSAAGVIYQHKVTVSEIGTCTGTCIVLSGADGRSFITDSGPLVEEMVLKKSETWDEKKKRIRMDDYDLEPCIRSDPGICMDDLIRTHHLHLSGFYNCRGLKEGKINVVELFKQAKVNKVTTSLIPQDDAHGKWDGLKEVCPYMDILIANEHEIINIAKKQIEADAAAGNIGDSSDSGESKNKNKRRKISGGDESKSKGKGGDESKSGVELSMSMSMLAEEILRWGCGTVVVTQGPEGASAFYLKGNKGNKGNKGDTRELVEEKCAAPKMTAEEIVDTTGAGDAFAAGFLAGMIEARCSEGEAGETLVLRRCLTRGCAAGSDACRYIGGSANKHT